MKTVAEVRSAALRLNQEERGALAEALLASLAGEPELQEQEWEDAWGVEITRRLEAWEAGRMKTIPGDEAIAMVRARLATLRG